VAIGTVAGRRPLTRTHGAPAGPGGPAQYGAAPDSRVWAHRRTGQMFARRPCARHNGGAPRQRRGRPGRAEGYRACRWHPDKFAQRFGQGQSEAVATKVKAVAQLINDYAL
jgi:hypothetical protein